MTTLCSSCSHSARDVIHMTMRNVAGAGSDKDDVVVPPICEFRGMMTDPECIQTFDGKHHYAPRRRLIQVNGIPADPMVKDHWYTVLSCACSNLAPNEDEVKIQLRATAEEKRRQKAEANKIIKGDKRQLKLL